MIAITFYKQIRLSQSIPQSKKNNYSDEEKQAFKERRTDGLLYFTKIKNKIPLILLTQQIFRMNYHQRRIVYLLM